MNILIVSLDLTRDGGIEIYTKQIFMSLHKNKNTSIKLVYPYKLYKGLLGKYLGRIKFLLKLFFLLFRSDKVLVMHSNLLKPIFLLSYITRYFNSFQTYCFIYGIEVWGTSFNKVSHYLSRCNKLIACSNFTAEKIKSRLPNLTNLPVLNPTSNLFNKFEPISPIPSDIVLLTVARIDKNENYKGHRLIIKALQLLLQDNIMPANLKWNIVGVGDGKSEIETLVVETKLEKYINFLGKLDRNQLKNQFQQSSVLVMPSSYSIRSDGTATGEGFGIAYLEAALAGRPSIGCKEGGQQDIIKDGITGWLIDSDPYQLSSLIFTLSQSKGLIETTGKQANLFALGNFDEETFASNLKKVINLS